MEPTQLQAKSQERASHAWICVVETRDNSEKEFRAQYSTLARKLPMMVLTNGLGQSLAFLLAKSKQKEPEHKRKPSDRAHAAIYQHISQWVTKEAIGTTDESCDLMNEVRCRNSSEYRVMTNETLAWLQWLKRFAEAELEGGDEDATSSSS